MDGIISPATPLSHALAKYARASALKYLDFLRRERRGVDRTEAQRESQLFATTEQVVEGETFFVFSFSTSARKKYRNGDTLTFVPLESLGNTVVRVVSYDSKSGGIELGFKEKKNWGNGHLEVDLKWLVKRTLDWIERRGNTLPICLPTTIQGIEPEQIRWLKAEPEPPLHPNQFEACQEALSKPLCYVWGPPGTGKTRGVLANLSLLLVNNGKRVLVLAPTNLALENALAAIIEMLPLIKKDDNTVLRMGFPSPEFRAKYPDCCEIAGRRKPAKDSTEGMAGLRDELQLIQGEISQRSPGGKLAWALDSKVGRETLSRLRTQAESLETRLEQAGMGAIASHESNLKSKDREVIGLTLDAYMGMSLEEGVRCDHILIDEGGYAPLIKVLPALATGVPLTLFGDHKQLPPVCESDSADAAIQSFWGKSSLFLEEAWKTPSPDKLMEVDTPRFSVLTKVHLKKSFRFGSDFAKVLDEYFYEGIGFNGLPYGTTIEILDGGDSSLDQDLDAGFEDWYRQRRATRSKGSFKRRREAIGEVDTIFRLLKGPQARKDIDWDQTAIVVPYKDQKRALLHAWGRRTKNNWIEILNAHKTQGLEWDTVIFSVVDKPGSQRRNPFFTDSLNDMGKLVVNTIVSRARTRLILVLDVKAWRREPHQFLGELVRKFS